MSAKSILVQTLQIDNGEIVLRLTEADAALLFQACERAEENTIELAERNLATAFRGWAGLFKAAALAVTCQGYMLDNYQEKAREKARHLLKQ